jgi:diguanylate cyclase (GGDEF)-like protein
MAGEAYRDVLINRRKDGALYYEEKTITPLKDGSGVVQHIVSTGKDITERMENEQRLHYLANHDVLTGLPNRALLVERLDHALTLMRNEHPLGVLFLDVDRFKVINDTLGHQTGDRLLRQLGKRLEHSVRRGDSVARLGGDEFAVLVEAVEATDELANTAQKIISALEQPFVLDDHPYFITASLGISVAPTDAADAVTLLKHADIAMYRAKELGRNRYHFYSAELGNQVLRRLRLESRLREALEQQHFRLEYQPQVDVRTGRIVGFEALLRWDSPERDLVEPDQFVPILEETGLILPLGEWALETACRQVMQWTDIGGDLRIGVNVSGRQFSDPDFVQRVDRILAGTGLAAQRLEVEITESTIMRDDPNTMRVFQELAKRGIRIAIDDFGTGYSSLSYLKRFPIDTLKIDRSFVRDVPRDSDDATIVQTILAMAGTLNLEVVAEGVETDEQFAFLSDYGCDLVQGYLFSRPLPPGPARQLLVEGLVLPGDNAMRPANDSIHTGPHSESAARPYVRLERH